MLAWFRSWRERRRRKQDLLEQLRDAIGDPRSPAAALETIHRKFSRFKSLLEKNSQALKVARLTISDFVDAGLGAVRAATLVAVFELARRIPSGDGTSRPFFRTPEDVSARYLSRLKDLNHEEFWVLLLTSANQLIREVRVTSGTLNSSLVHPRECFSEAIKHKAAGVIFLHNHPSGNAEPSQEDIAITRQLVEAGKILGIPVHDHLILAGANCTSLAGRSLM